MKIDKILSTFFWPTPKERENEDIAVIDSCEEFLASLPQKLMYLEKCVLLRFYTEFFLDMK